MAWILGLLGFSKLKFFLIIGALLGFTAIVTGAYVKGRMDCGNAVAIQKLKDENRILRRSIAILKEDGERALKDAADSAAFDKKAEEIEENIDDGACFGDADSKRLRELWSTP